MIDHDLELTDKARLLELEAEAAHARDRYRLYRAKAYGSRATSPARLRDLERTWMLADSRLARAKAARATVAAL